MRELRLINWPVLLSRASKFTRHRPVLYVGVVVEYFGISQ